jgi:signal transduction histidine kinase
VRESQRCKIIIQEMLEFARDSQPRKRCADLNLIIEKSLTILENEMRLRHIQLEKCLSKEIKETLLDENQLEQVFVNLLINAIQAVNEYGVIIVGTRMGPKGEFIEAEIIDTGCGIAKENLDKIFEPFFSTKKEGSGLGLAVSYGIIQNHQGRIKVESQEGESTRFRISLPVVSESASRD